MGKHILLVTYVMFSCIYKTIVSSLFLHSLSDSKIQIVPPINSQQYFNF